MPCYTWKCVPATISGGVDTYEGPGCYLLQWISSMSRSQKFLQELVSFEFTAYLSVFYLFFDLMKYDHFIEST